MGDNLEAEPLVDGRRFPFEPRGAHDWSGFFFIVWALALFVAAGLLAVQTARAGNDLAAVGYVAVALYGLGTTLNASLLARGLVEASVRIQPGRQREDPARCVGDARPGSGLIGLSCRLAGWVRTVGLAAAAGHAIAATAVLFGAELPHTGAEASDWLSLLVAVSKLLMWATMVGWILDQRRQPDYANRTNCSAISPLALPFATSRRTPHLRW